jgi:uncharacterized membrane protein YdjX (TVP38/TMEM64 family)
MKHRTRTLRAWWHRWGKPGIVLALLVLFVLALWQMGDPHQVLARKPEREAALRQFQDDHPVLMFAAAFLLYVAVTGLSLPGATPLSLVYGWYFGFPAAVVLVSFASTTGATIAFLISRYLLRDAVRNRFGGFLRKVDRELERDGVYYLLMLRLVVGLPYFVVNLVMGLTPMRIWTYWWVSQLGMLPATAVYCYAGSVVPDLATLAERGLQEILTWQLALALTLLGIFPLVVRLLVTRWRAGRGQTGLSDH